MIIFFLSKYHQMQCQNGQNFKLLDELENKYSYYMVVRFCNAVVKIDYQVKAFHVLLKVVRL